MICAHFQLSGTLQCKDLQYFVYLWYSFANPTSKKGVDVRWMKSIAKIQVLYAKIRSKKSSRSAPKRVSRQYVLVRASD